MLGLVAGATDTTALQQIRKRAPTAWILCPGVGAQGGDAKVSYLSFSSSFLILLNLID
jgi:uridine monophosphate synthetase